MFFYRWPFITPPGNPSIASFWPPCWHQDLLVKHHFCIWLGSHTEPADLLCLLCLFCVCIPPPTTFTSRRAFLKNHCVAGKYLMFFGSCFHIFKFKKKYKKAWNRPKTTHVLPRQWINLCSNKYRGWTGARVKRLLHYLCFSFSPIESSIKVLRLQEKLQVATRSATSPQSVGFISCIHLGKSPEEGEREMEGETWKVMICRSHSRWADRFFLYCQLSHVARVWGFPMVWRSRE